GARSAGGAARFRPAARRNRRRCQLPLGRVLSAHGSDDATKDARGKKDALVADECLRTRSGAGRPRRGRGRTCDLARCRKTAAGGRGRGASGTGPYRPARSRGGLEMKGTVKTLAAALVALALPAAFLAQEGASDR